MEMSVPHRNQVLFDLFQIAVERHLRAIEY